MSIQRIIYEDLISEEEWRCPDCGSRLNRYPWSQEWPAIVLCVDCDVVWVDTCNMLKWLGSMNRGQLIKIPGAGPNDLPTDNFRFCAMLGGKNPNSGNDIKLDKLLSFLSDMVEE